MKIRSITYFFNPGWPPDESHMQTASAFLTEARQAFETVGYEVQTIRLATPPYSHLLGRRIKEAPYFAEAMETLLAQTGIDYASLGPAFPDVPGSYAIIPEALAHTSRIFFSGVMADARNGISLAAVRACAEVIVKCAPLTPDGFANLRFAALANVTAGAPFFPAAYHLGEAPSFALATEAADLAVQAFTGESSLTAGRGRLTNLLEEHGGVLVSVSERLSRRFTIEFSGIDFSLAPFPSAERSLGCAVEHLGVPRIGLHGSLAAAAILTEAVERASFPHTGFSGFMQPLLEDAVLAERASQGTLTIKDLLLYSAVCGTGLDTVPLPGDTNSGQIAALLLDLCALALRLDKPLTARLMPIPGKAAGERTEFDFPYFANSTVMSLDSGTLNAALASEEVLKLNPLTRWP